MRLGWSLLLVVTLFACKHEEPPAPDLVPPTAAEAESFAKEVAGYAQACDLTQLDRVLDVDGLLDRALAGRKMMAGEGDGMRTGFKRTFGGKSLCTEVAPGGTPPSYLWVRNANGSGNPIIRVLSDGGISYIELVLDKRGAAIRIVDFYPYALGELMSSAVSKMIDTANNNSADAVKLTSIKNFMANNQPKQARATIRDLPVEWRTSKPIMLMDLTAAGQINDDAEYLRALEAFSAAFPGDPALDLVEIDSAYLKKNYTHVIEILDRLDHHLGGDPYLDVLRANSYLQLGKPDKALVAIKNATTKVPEVEDGWWTLLAVQGTSHDYAGAIQTLEHLRDHFKAKVDAASIEGRYPSVVASKEFAVWSAPKK